MLEDQRGYQPVGVLVYHGKLPEEYHTHPKLTDTFKPASLCSLLQDRNTQLALNLWTFGVLAYYLMASTLYQQQLKGLCLTQEAFK